MHNVDLYHTTNRTATTNSPISLAGVASLGKCGYGNEIAVMERISGTVLLTTMITFFIKPNPKIESPFTTVYFFRTFFLS